MDTHLKKIGNGLEALVNEIRTIRKLLEKASFVQDVSGDTANPSTGETHEPGSNLQTTETFNQVAPWD